MKKTIMSFAFAAFFGMLANAQQDQSGVYLSQDDFENNKLTYGDNGESETNKIRFNEFFDKPFITVNQNGKKEQLFKDDIFAYKNKGKIVRTWNFTSYNFLEKGTIWIYYKDFNVSRGKGIRRERKYFYSTSGSSEIIPLTIFNIKKSFPHNHLFHDFLNAQFRYDNELSAYDGFERKYKINHILETTISKIE
ncbi:MAG: hypothetical protein ACXWWC_08410 [Chitinophagaceae bacterium]